MATTSDMRFMAVGDLGFITFNVEMRDEYHITKDKKYPMQITGKRYGFELVYTNDAGVLVKTEYDRNDERDGYESIEVLLDDAVFDARVEELYAKNAAERIAKHEEEMQSWRAYCDKVKEDARK